MIVLDTHAWVWWVARSARLPDATRRHIEAADRIGVSAISCWEVAMLVRKQRLGLDRELGEWIPRALRRPRLEALPVTPEMALLAGTLEMHGDPADRLLVATALVSGCALVSCDEAIAASGLVPTVWRTAAED